MNVYAFPGRQNSSRYLRRPTAMVVATLKSGLTQHDSPKFQKAKRSVNPNFFLDHRQPALSAEPDSQLRQQAMAQAQQGNYLSVISILSQLIDRNPNSAIDYNNRGLAYFQSGQLDKALTDYDRALQLNPRLANVYNNRANYYATQGRLAEAIADYDTALDLNPGNLRVWLNQGITFRDLEMYEQAIENFDLALRFSQSLLETRTAESINLEAHLYAERGRTYHLLGDWNCAIADYGRVLNQLSQPSSSGSTTSRLCLQVEAWLAELVSPWKREG